MGGAMEQEKQVRLSGMYFTWPERLDDYEDGRRNECVWAGQVEGVISEGAYVVAMFHEDCETVHSRRVVAKAALGKLRLFSTYQAADRDYEELMGRNPTPEAEG